MGKQPGKEVVAAISVICLLLFPLLMFFSSDAKQREVRSCRRGASQEKKANYKWQRAEEPMEYHLRRLVRGEDRVQLDATGFACRSDQNADVCIARKPVRIVNKELALYVPSHRGGVNRTIKPYPLKEDRTAMERVSEIQVLYANAASLPPCQFNHDVPVVIFSSGGFSGNMFHEINEIIIPLFLTARHFQGRLQFLIVDYEAWWVNKYSRVLSQLSDYGVINPTEDGSIHCFPGAVVGLTYHDHMSINSTKIPGGYSLFDFKHFLRQSYGLGIKHVSEVKKPILILISRSKSRKFMNEPDMVKMMEDLGFQVIVARPYMMSNLSKFAEVLNSCKVLVGAHGAGLTNEVFMPDRAVMVQVVPLGLEWAAANYYGIPASRIGLHYLEYKIEPEESSLLDQYGRDHPVIADPKSIFSQGYRAARAVYIDQQQLKIDVPRFRETLVRAMELIGGFPLSNRKIVTAYTMSHSREEKITYH